MSTKLKCLLLDDELPALSYIKAMCEQIEHVEVIKAFNDPKKFLKAIPELDFDVCILDVQMPGINGLEVGRHLDGKFIIFTTAHKEFAAEAFDINAIDYIRKPIQKERFEKAMNKAFAALELKNRETKNHAIWNTDKGKAILNFKDILYITSSDTDSRDKLVYLQNGNKTTIKNTSFEQIMAVLPVAKFCRINKKDLIALKIVKHFTSEEITTDLNIKPAVKLILSDVYRDEFRLKIKSQ